MSQHGDRFVLGPIELRCGDRGAGPGVGVDQYKCIVADPPWMERGGGKSKRGADRHYPLMNKQQIVKTMMPVIHLSAAKSCHLWMWTTDNYERDAHWVIEQLGFRYIRNLVWVKMRDDKLQIGLGQYLRGSHELCKLAVRGDSMVPPPADRMPSVFIAPRGKHSEKPDESFRIIERASPGPRLEMFARRATRPGWDFWGNEL